jgi:thioredoxin-dependent peroxiredoxin
MATERAGAVKFKGNPMTLVGPALKPGDKAPEFNVLGPGLTPVNLASSKGKVRFFSVVPSLDTGICSMQTKKFNEAVAKLPPSVQAYTVSLDLPFAQARFCSAEKIDKMVSLSDHRETSFGTAYGVLIKELRLLARSIFVVGKDDKITYVQLVPEVTTEPNYDQALDAVRAAAK